MSHPNGKYNVFTFNLQSSLLTMTTGNSQHCNESVVLTLLTAPPVLPTENNLQQSWAADRKAWKEYDEEDWLMRQAFEPDMPHNGRSIFFRWLNETVEGKNWICSVPLNGEGTWCDHDPFKRPDRAIAHVRWHLKHTPFACGGQCRNEGWYVPRLSW